MLTHPQLDEVLLQDAKMVQTGANGVFVKSLRPASESNGENRRKRNADLGIRVETQIAFSKGINATDLDEAFNNATEDAEAAQSIANVVQHQNPFDNCFSFSCPRLHRGRPRAFEAAQSP